MADQRISELTTLEHPDILDEFPIVDVSAGQTKKVTYQELTDFPHGSFSDSTTQGIASATAAYPVTFDTDEAKSHITHDTGTNPSRITVDKAGTYLITFSAVAKSNAANKLVEFWLAVDGANVARSNTVSKFVGNANERIITVTFLYTFTAGQYFEIMWRSDDTGTTLVATAAGANPTRPASPSIILTINLVSFETGD
jgi:hypothetical protein